MKKNIKKIILVAGARPNFMKIAPLMKELQKHKEFQPMLVHTGQHYDPKMSSLFFQQLKIPEPDVNLEVGSASHAVQTSRIMERFEKVCLEEKPDLVIVVGDVNSTAACTLVASKLHIKTAHYEAGLRSRDREMPEEINRLVTDAICDLFYTTSLDADENLINEGVGKKQIQMVGNLMIDSLKSNLVNSAGLTVNLETIDGKTIKLGEGLIPGQYGMMTFHRPSNVDHKASLEALIHIWGEISRKIKLAFPAHPRTLKNAEKFGLLDKLKSYENIFLTEPVGYLEFINLLKSSKFALTDSGGIQEETTYMGIPCLTVRPNTERPVTIWEGTNQLIKIEDIIPSVNEILEDNGKVGKCPKFWDGDAAARIVEHLKSICKE